MKQIGENEENYAIVRRIKTMLLNTEKSELPAEIQELLGEFKDIVVDDLPISCLPRGALAIISILYLEQAYRIRQHIE